MFELTLYFMLTTLSLGLTVIILYKRRNYLLERFYEKLKEKIMNDIDKSEIINDFTNRFTESILEKIKMSGMGSISGDKRLQRALSREMIDSVLSNVNPLASAVLSNMPEVKKMIMNNPEIISQLVGFLGKGKGFNTNEGYMKY